MQFWRLSARAAAPRRTYTRLRATRSYTQGPAQGPARKPFVILACDGGGCRGFLSIKLIERLDAAVPDFLDRVDMFAGTSTGSVIAAMLASGATPSEVAANYEEWCPAIFAQPRSLIRRAFAAKFSNKPLRGALDEFFGDLRVTQLPRRFLCPALRVDGEASATTSAEVWRLSASREGGWRPAVMSNLPAIAGARPDVELRVADALLRSAAAPTLLPLYQGYADGGIWANNPSMLAVTKTSLHYGLPPADVRVMSVGAGSWARRVVEPDASSKQNDLGLVPWSGHLVEMLLDASALTTDLEASFLLRDDYHRLSPNVPPGESLALDDATALPRMHAIAGDTDLDRAVAFAERVLAEASTEVDSVTPADGERLEDTLQDIDSRTSAELVDRAWTDLADKWRRARDV